MAEKTVIIIVGPTASGKTALSLALARHLDTEIISADSRQCFRELNIGVAKPSDAELHLVKHYFINSHSVHDTVNAQVFEQYALDAVKKIFEAKQYAVMVGGTGLYIKAFCEGLDAIPAAGDEIRQHIITQYKVNGLSWLQQEVIDNDPEFWEEAEQQNPHRLIRALEIKLGTGRSILSFRKKKPSIRPFKIIKIGIEPGREQLYHNINVRVDDMLQKGLVEEVRSLLPLRHLNALQTVGYKELIHFFDGKYSFEKAVEQLKINTRHYAKRQFTWFKKDASIYWKPHFDMAYVDFLLHESNIANK